MLKLIAPIVLLVASGPALASYSGNVQGASNRLANATDRLYHNLSYSYAQPGIVDRAARLAKRADRLHRQTYRYRGQRKLWRNLARIQRDFARLDRAIYRAGPFHGKRQVIVDLRRVSRALYRVENTLAQRPPRKHRHYERRYARAW